MTSSPSTVISEGFGSFGSVNLLITDGYGIGTAPPPPPSLTIRTQDIAGRPPGLSSLTVSPKRQSTADLVGRPPGN